MDMTIGRYGKMVPLLMLATACVAEALPDHRRLVLSPEVFAEGACFADVDGDGVLDLITGPFFHLGPDLKQSRRFRPGEATSPDGYGHDCFLSWVHDFNKDGRADILQVGHKQGFNLVLYLQPEEASENWLRHVVIERFGHESPEFTDVTGDGVPELVAMHEGRFGFFSIPADDPTKPWPFHAISGERKPFPYFHGMGIGDVNGDGRPDIVEKDGWFEAPEKPMEQEWTHHDFRFSEPGGAQMLIYDIDGDGDNDIVTSLAAHAWGLAWFEQIEGDGGIGFRKHELMPETDAPGIGGIRFTQAHALATGDFNGDGLTDFVTGKRYWAHNGRDPDAKGRVVLYWFELRREGKTASFIPHLLHDDTGAGTQVSVADINGDGISDLGIANKKGVFAFLSGE
jgi:hypothetical protein